MLLTGSCKLRSGGMKNSTREGAFFIRGGRVPLYIGQWLRGVSADVCYSLLGAGERRRKVLLDRLAGRTFLSAQACRVLFFSFFQDTGRPVRGRFLNESGGFGFRIAAGSAALPNGAVLPDPSRAGNKLAPADGAATGFTDPRLLSPGLLGGEQLDDDLVERTDELADSC